MERATLIGKSMGGHRESHLIFYEVPLDEKRVIRELARMYSGYLRTPSEGQQQ